MTAGKTCEATVKATNDYSWCNNPCIDMDTPIQFMCPCMQNDTVTSNTEPAMVSPSVQCKPCAASVHVVDSDVDRGKFTGTIRWGPNMFLNRVDETMIEGYRVYVVDHWGVKLSISDDTVDGEGEDCTDDCVEVPSRDIQHSCCDSFAYNVTWSLSLPLGYDRFMVVAWHSVWGPLPAGVYIPIHDEGGAGCLSRRSLPAALYSGAVFGASTSRVAATMMAMLAVGVSAIKPEKLLQTTCAIHQGEALLTPTETATLCSDLITTPTTTTTTWAFNNITSTYAWAKPCGCAPFPLYGTLYGAPTDTRTDSICEQGKSPECYVDVGDTCAAFVHTNTPGSNPCIAAGTILFKCPTGNTEGGRQPELVSGNIVCLPCYAPPRVVDIDMEEGRFEGVITWGPNLIRGVVNDTMIEGYRVYIVDTCGFPLPGHFIYAEVQSLGVELDCCDTLMYSATLQMALPEGYDRFMIVAFHSAWGELPSGAFVQIEDNVRGSAPPDLQPCGGGSKSSVAAATSAAALAISASSKSIMAASALAVFSTCGVAGQSTTVTTTPCDILHGQAILTPQIMAPYCTTETTSTSTSTSTTSTSTSVTSTTTTTSDFVPCMCPYLNTSLYGGIGNSDSLGDGATCCGIPSGQSCTAYSSNYADYLDTKTNLCIKNGPIEFKCPCGNLGNDTMPYLISANVLCKPCAVTARVIDKDWAPGKFLGRISWGPNMIDDRVDETMIEGYRVYVVDEFGVPLSVPDGPDYLAVPSHGLSQDCCYEETYAVEWALNLPEGFHSFSIVAWNSQWGMYGSFDGSLPVGETVRIYDAPDVPRPPTPAPRVARATTHSESRCSCHVGLATLAACFVVLLFVDGA